MNCIEYDNNFEIVTNSEINNTINFFNNVYPSLIENGMLSKFILIKNVFGFLFFKYWKYFEKEKDYYLLRDLAMFNDQKFRRYLGETIIYSGHIAGLFILENKIERDLKYILSNVTQINYYENDAIMKKIAIKKNKFSIINKLLSDTNLIVSFSHDADFMYVFSK